MLRIASIVVFVLVLDFVLFYVAVLGTLDVNMVQTSKALAAQMDNPTPENKRALDAARREASLIQLKIRAGFGAAILIVTAGGFFIAGCQFERRRRLSRLSIASDNATIHT
jgi:hypothetical protein